MGVTGLKDMTSAGTLVMWDIMGQCKGIERNEAYPLAQQNE